MRRNKNGSVARYALLLLACVAFSSLTYGDTCDRMQVNFKAGQLSIQSNGCSLQQVLEAVQEKTGIQLDMPPLAATVPITVNIEPGEPTAVLATLLAGTKFNYIIVAGGAGNLPAQVILTDVPAAPVATAAPAVAAAKPDTSAPDTAAVVATKEPVKPKKAKDKEKEKESGKKAESQVAAAEDDGGQPKPEIDDSTLKKLPQLPAGIPAAMWRLYPDLVQNVLQNGGSLSQDAPALPGGGALGQPAAGQAGQLGQPGVATNFMDPPPLPKGVVGLPTLPPGIDPNMGKLYPWNLMQTIPGPIIYPNIKLPPMAQPISGLVIPGH